MIHAQHRRQPSFCIRVLFAVALALVATGTFADHGGSSHINVNLSVPATDDDGNYLVTWNSGTLYRLQEKKDAGSYVSVYYGTLGFKSITGKTNGTYSYRIEYEVCFYECFYLYSEPESVIVTLGLGTPTAIVGPDEDEDGTFTLSWGSVSGATYYELQRWTATSSWTTVQSTSATTHQASSLPIDLYKYKVRACDSGGCGSFTVEKTVDVIGVPGGGGDPFPPPGPFTPPDDNDFPDAAIINPSVPTGDVYGNSVGAVKGNGGVSGGQASYSIPIIVPPGRRNMQPSIALNYSSSAGGGIAGVGWSLSGISAISRCGPTAAQDDYTVAVQYDAALDKLCLDGQRLVLESGTYGASGARYRTELDSFTRVWQLSSINSASSYFYVYYKDGRIARHATSADARHSASGRTENMTWSISDMRDRSGNTITYDYSEHGAGEHLLDAIHYTGINGADGNRHVEFVYEARPDVRTFYRAGGKTRSTKRLSAVRTKYQSTLVREYTLNYGAVSQSSSRSLLRSVQECAFENGVTAHCLPPTTFEWAEAAQQFVTERLQFHDPDNILQSGTPVIRHSDKRWLHDVMPSGDQDGDGVKDWTDMYVNAEGQVTGDHNEQLANCFRTSSSLAMTCLQADFNADGLSDSIRSNNDIFEFRLAGTSNWVSTGVKWGDYGPPLGTRHDYPMAFADFNGDGWPDMAIKQNSQLWVYFHTQSLAAPYSNTSRQLLVNYITDPTGYTDTTTVMIPGDMDGNGIPDFVVARPANVSNEAPGLPVPTKIILVKPNLSGTISSSSRYFSNLAITPNVNANFFHDINGDGLPDLVSLSPTTFNLQYRPNDGVDFVGAWIDLGISVPTWQGDYQPAPYEWETVTNPIMSMIVSMDYDGDGRQEILVPDYVVASGCAETPTGPGQSLVWRCDDDLYSEYNESNPWGNYWPINSQAVDDSVRKYKGIRFTEDASGNVSSSTFTTSIIASATQTAIVDATGDGLPDVVTVLGCRQTSGCEFNTETAGRPGTVQNSTYVEGAWINRNLGTAADDPLVDEFEFAAYDLMSAAEDGLGNRHEWTYRPLSSDAYGKVNTDYYDTDHGDDDPDYFHFASSMYVVADHRASNGIGGLNSTKYRYRSAIYNNKGRGFQGFKSIIVEEDIFDDTHPLADTDKITRTDFHQKWPLSGQLEQSCTWLADEAVADDNATCSFVISQTTVNSIRNVATVGGARFVAVEDQTTQSFDLLNRASLLTTKQVQLDFDDAGNVKSETKTHIDEWTTNSTVTTRNFTLNWSSWWLNKLDSQVVQHGSVSARHATSPAIDPGTDNTKTVTTSYTAYDTGKRLPTTIVVTGNDTPLSLTTTTQYNARGLPTQVSITGTDVTGPRTVDTTYTDNGTTVSDDGYFPLTIVNALGHELEQHTDPPHGQPTSQWDPNDLVSVTSYDPFGRVSEVTPAGQPTAYQRYFWCGGATSCPNGASFMVMTLGAGAPETHRYLDQFGRELQSSINNFAGTSFINVSTSFDERGNKTFESQPYDIAAGEYATIGTRYLSYDALGRLQSKEIDQADGTIFLTTYNFDGLKTTINAGGLSMYRTYNGLEQLVETQDAEGGITRYAYDGAGNPIALQDPNSVLNPSTPYITASYNALGHKQWVDDPNMGLKSFAYSAAGEVLSELDANGDTVSMVYDVLGRMTSRLVNGALNGHWVYDNTDTNKGLGLLDYEDSQFRSDGSRLQKFYYYSDTTGGRKDLLQVTHRFYENTNQNDFDDYDTAYFTDGYYGRPKGLRYPGGISLAYSYNNAGYVTHEKDPVTAYVYRHITTRDSRNQVKQSTLTNGLLTHTAQYYPATGQMKQITASNGSGTVHDLYYEYDTFGNVDYQTTTYTGGSSSETFVYDDLHRLTQSSRSVNGGAAQIINYTFDPSGNITSKSDYASNYTYLTSRPNAVQSVDLVGGGSASFGYDGNGNMETGHNKTLTYNAFNKPVTIVQGGVWSSFTYGADLMRYRQEKSTGVITYYLDKLMEIESTGTSTDYRHYLSDIAILTKTGDLNDPNPGIDFVHRDRLGSLATITDKYGLSAQARGFDPFGKPRDGSWADRNPPTLGSNISDRGFTEHEHLDDFQLIHMNGRAYDYNLGRFLSVDPFIQAPSNSQSLNPYSYIMNNPLAGVDPSGYCSAATGTRLKNCKEYGITAVNTDTGEVAKSVASVNTYDTATSTTSPGAGAQIRDAIFSTAREAGIQQLNTVHSGSSIGNGNINQIGSGSNNVIGADGGIDGINSLQQTTSRSSQTIAATNLSQTASLGSRTGAQFERDRANAHARLNQLLRNGTLDTSTVFVGPSAVDLAAQDVLLAIHEISQEFAVELYGLIIANGDGASYTAPVVGNARGALLDGRGAMGGYHTHPTRSSTHFSDRFSAHGGGLGDVEWVMFHEIPLYLSYYNDKGIVSAKVCRPGSATCRATSFRRSRRGEEL